MKCLVVDDNPDDRSVVERVLSRTGYQIQAAASGPMALQMLEKETFDVVLVDLGMNEMSGAETMRALRKRDPSLRLLVVSGFEDRRHVLEALASGADGYIVRHEIGERLVTAVQEVAAGKSPMSARVSSILLHSYRRTQPNVAVRPERPRPAELPDTAGEIDLPGKKS
jgi:DNA-binding NarL/FixJ family response regulator